MSRDAGWLANLDQERAAIEEVVDLLSAGTRDLLPGKDVTLLIASIARNLHASNQPARLALLAATAIVRLAQQPIQPSTGE